MVSQDFVLSSATEPLTVYSMGGAYATVKTPSRESDGVRVNRAELLFSWSR